MAGTVVDHRAYFDSGISFFDFEVIFACISGDDMGVIENHVYLFVDMKRQIASMLRGV